MSEPSEFDRFLQKQLDEDPEFRREWERSEPLYSVIGAMLRRRAELDITQAQLAERMGKKQPAIARFEAGNAENPTLGFLQDLAEALGMELVVSLQPRKEPSLAVGRVAEHRERYSAS
jgi:transcriptional regulator with XRE-family HTH domain